MLQEEETAGGESGVGKNKQKSGRNGYVQQLLLQQGAHDGKRNNAGGG